MIDVQHSSATYYYHYDPLGSVVALSNASGTTVETYEYSAFGEVAATDADNPNPFTFTGREFDKETGLYFYRARYYAPEIGRFLQTNPVGYADSMTLDGYCVNSPLGLTDPFGTTDSLDAALAIWSAIFRSLRPQHDQLGRWWSQPQLDNALNPGYIAMIKELYAGAPRNPIFDSGAAFQAYLIMHLALNEYLPGPDGNRGGSATAARHGFRRW
jgi:RHS repeat-associated protein